MTSPKKHIRTFSGRELNIFHIKEEDISIEDIGHALSQVNRFNGHVRRPISVAQHSVDCARLCVDTDFEAHALLHDASEAYIGDVTKWLKQEDAMGRYREVEDDIQKTIFRRFGLSTRMPAKVIEADRIMVRFEGRRGFGKSFTIDHPDYPPLTKEQIARVGEWKHWGWDRAKWEFLAYYGHLQLRRKIR